MNDPKRLADRMRASATIVEILGPFDTVERVQILVTTLGLVAHDGSPGAKAIDDLLKRVEERTRG